MPLGPDPSPYQLPEFGSESGRSQCSCPPVLRKDKCETGGGGGARDTEWANYTMARARGAQSGEVPVSWWIGT